MTSDTTVFRHGREAALRGEPRKYTKLREPGRFIGCPYNAGPVTHLQPAWLAGYDSVKQKEAD